MKPQILLLIGPPAETRAAAIVARQIAQQHHGVSMQIVHGHANPDIRYQIVCRPTRGGTYYTRSLYLDRFPRPRGRAMTFALREAIDALVAPQQKQ